MSLRPTTLIAALIAVAIAACGGQTEERPRAAAPTDDPGPVHLHGLGVNARDAGRTRRPVSPPQAAIATAISAEDQGRRPQAHGVL